MILESIGMDLKSGSINSLKDIGQGLLFKYNFSKSHYYLEYGDNNICLTGLL